MKPLGLASVLLLGLLFGCANAALGTEPRASVERHFDSFTAENQLHPNCSGEFTLHIEGGLGVVSVDDNDGNLVRQRVTPHGQYTVTLSANGRTLVSQSPYVVMIGVDDNTQLLAGLVYGFHVPGSGMILLETGLFFYGGTPESLLVAGPHQMLEGDTAALCAYFAAA